MNNILKTQDLNMSPWVFFPSNPLLHMQLEFQGKEMVKPPNSFTQGSVLVQLHRLLIFIDSIYAKLSEFPSSRAHRAPARIQEDDELRHSELEWALCSLMAPQLLLTCTQQTLTPVTSGADRLPGESWWALKLLQEELGLLHSGPLCIPQAWPTKKSQPSNRNSLMGDGILEEAAETPPHGGIICLQLLGRILPPWVSSSKCMATFIKKPSWFGFVIVSKFAFLWWTMGK